MTWALCRRRTGEAVPRAEKFGDLITADHKVFNEVNLNAVAVQDLTTQWIQSYRDGKVFQKVSQAVGKAKSHLNRQFIGIWQKSCEDRAWNH